VPTPICMPEMAREHDGRQESAHRVLLPAGGAHDGGDRGAARSAQECKHPRLRLDMQNSSQERRRNSAPEGWRNSAPPPPKPRGDPRGGGGEEARAIQARCPCPHAHAPCALNVQRKLSNGVAGFAAGGSSSDRKRSRPIRAFSARPMMANVRADPGRTQPRAAYPQRRSSNAEWSSWPEFG
jgi:hypothetical protein